MKLKQFSIETSHGLRSRKDKMKYPVMWYIFYYNMMWFHGVASKVQNKLWSNGITMSLGYNIRCDEILCEGMCWLVMANVRERERERDVSK